MSYILDALKRAERERRRGQAPATLDDAPLSAPATSDAPRRSPRLWLGLILLALALLTIAFVLLRPRKTPAAAPVEPTTAPAAAPRAAARKTAPPIVAPAPAPAPLAAQTAPSVTLGDGHRISSLDDLTEPAPPPSPKPVHPAASAARPGPRPPASPPKPGVSRSPVTAAAPPDAAPTVSPYTLLKDMPPAYRADFPTLTVDVHAYNSDPARCFVLVNGQRYGNGDTLAAGPKIVAIVPDGIVVAWKGQQVLVPR